MVLAHFDKIDANGHRSAFGPNEKYINGIIVADALIGSLIDAIEEVISLFYCSCKSSAESGLISLVIVMLFLIHYSKATRKREESWLVVVTSDHGGHGKSHDFGWNDDEGE